jgi:nucleotide-binding universal stress UspA family protein
MRPDVPGPQTRPSMDDAPVLICYDGSSESRRAITVAARLLTGREAVVVDVAPLDAVAGAYAAAGSGAAELGNDVRADTAARAEEGAALARQAGFDAHGRGALATPRWRGVVGAADEVDAAVIVVGRGTHGRLGDLLEEHVGHDVAEHAHRPVLVIP